jgi:uncharacterized protein (TIGR03790 family)
MTTSTSSLTRRDLLFALAGMGFAARTADAQPKPKRMAPVGVNKVLVVRNTASPDAVAIADYYIAKRRVPKSNILNIKCPTTEDVSRADYDATILEPTRRFLANSKIKPDYILLTKGIPIRVSEGAFSVDSLLVTLDFTLMTNRNPNPYFGKDERFSHEKTNLYLVTRLDGYTRKDCLRLVDNAIAAKPTRGPFLLVPDLLYPPSYKVANDGILNAKKILTQRGFSLIYDEAPKQPAGKNLAGYFTWGNNGHGYKREVYKTNTFVPGAIAETVVSTSGRTFSNPDAPGQSLIADLIAAGVTGCKGYVSEPYVDAIADAGLLFDRYTMGYTLAESFYAASRWIYWKDVVIGDPICAPYSLAPLSAKQK